MTSAQQLVAMLLETTQQSVCGYCEKEHGPVPAQPGMQKSHGVCRRHAIANYTANGMDTTKLMTKPESAFAPDLSKATSGAPPSTNGNEMVNAMLAQPEFNPRRPKP